MDHWAGNIWRSPPCAWLVWVGFLRIHNITFSACRSGAASGPLKADPGALLTQWY